MNEELRNNDLQDQLTDLIYSDDFEISKIKPSDWSEKMRIMTSEVSAFPGPFSYDRTPYLREPADCLSQDHPARKVAVMKGSQIGFSTGVIENGIGWIISENPGPIFMLTGSADLSKQSVETKIDQMIDSCGLRPSIRPNTMRAKNSRTGDTSTSKEFAGGRLQTGQTGNHNKLRQVSMQYGFIDDFEAAPHESKQSGSTTMLIEMRFASYYEKMKLFYISTPEIKGTSNIEPEFLKGDQRYWNVPCPCCGDYIVLEWKIVKDGKTYGITWKLDDKNKLIPESVGYLCQSCGQFFNDSDKYSMNLAGKWIPTITAEDPSYFSYHISAIYAPPGMYDWSFYVRQYLEACPPVGSVDQGKYKTFVNTVLGKTWEERGEKPKANKLALNTRLYDIGVIPNELSKSDGNGEIVLVTISCDLNGIVDDARIDYEIVAWSESGCSYSVDHGSVGTFIPRENTVKKKVDRSRWSYEHYAQNSVWPEFLDIATQSIPLDCEEDKSMKPVVLGIDTGHYTTYAYEAMEKANGLGLFTLGIKGKNADVFRKMGADSHVWRKSKERDDLILVEVNQVKNELAELIKLRWDERDGISQPVGFMNFPTPSNGKYTMKSYFSQFESEHKVLNRSKDGQVVGAGWVKRNASVMNHLWDVRIYNMALREIFSEMLCSEHGIKYGNWQAYCKIVIGNG